MNRLDVEVSGGCQCGAVRYHSTQMHDNSHLCHCRMCQKAFGSFFAALAGGVLKEDFEVTRGTIATFNSSDEAERGFCAKCGTPLTFRYFTSKWIAASIGSLDQPELVKPNFQYGTESRLSWFHELPNLPGEATEDDQSGAGRIAQIRATNHQHPDYDTDRWPPEASQ